MSHHSGNLLCVCVCGTCHSGDWWQGQDGDNELCFFLSCMCSLPSFSTALLIFLSTRAVLNTSIPSPHSFPLPPPLLFLYRSFCQSFINHGIQQQSSSQPPERRGEIKLYPDFEWELCPQRTLIPSLIRQPSQYWFLPLKSEPKSSQAAASEIKIQNTR